MKQGRCAFTAINVALFHQTTGSFAVHINLQQWKHFGQPHVLWCSQRSTDHRAPTAFAAFTLMGQQVIHLILLFLYLP